MYSLLCLLHSFQIVEAMRLLGMTPQQATEYAIWRIARKAGPFNGALIAINKDGDHGKPIPQFNTSFLFYFSEFYLYINYLCICRLKLLWFKLRDLCCQNLSDAQCHWSQKTVCHPGYICTSPYRKPLDSGAVL